MTEDGILGIMKRGNTYQVRYASYNPHGMDRPSYQCPDEGTLVALLRRCGMDPWYIHQAGAELQKGGFAALPIALAEAQIQTYFSPKRAPRVSINADHAGAEEIPMAIILLEEVLMGLDEVKASLEQALTTLDVLVEDLSPTLGEALRTELEQTLRQPLQGRLAALEELQAAVDAMAV